MYNKIFYFSYLHIAYKYSCKIYLNCIKDGYVSFHKLKLIQSKPQINWHLCILSNGSVYENPLPIHNIYVLWQPFIKTSFIIQMCLRHPLIAKFYFDSLYICYFSYWVWKRQPRETSGFGWDECWKYNGK